ncbi:MAG TPA: PilW family protein [Gammaproteobacteria bacterium]|nr:PilW family protein [Gammaproteobacteria bacterium]
MHLKARGFTVIELLIAMVLGLLLSGTIVTVFVENRRSFANDESMMRMQDDARQAVREIVNDLSMAGFWADLVLPTAILPDLSLAVTSDCGPAATVNWIYQTVTPGTNDSLALEGVDNATAANANAAFSCIAPGEFQAGTDIVSVKRVVGRQQAPGTVTANTVYLRTNGTFGMLYREPANTPPAIPIPLPYWEWEYRPSVYYIRNFAVTAGDGIPTLCRKILDYSGAAPTMTDECLAQGIEDLQIEYGVDTNGDGDPNVYVDDPTLDELQASVTARVYLIARTADPDRRYTNPKTYQIGNAPAIAPADNFYRRVYSVTVGLRNVGSLNNLRS